MERIKIGIDYWNVISAYPEAFRRIAEAHLAIGDEVHVISAIGRSRIGTIAAEVANHGIPVTGVHEVVFDHPSESPKLKTEAALHLGLCMFYDDRDDVCAEMTKAGILALRVTRKSPGSDVNEERA